MHKKGGWALGLSIALVVILAVGAFLFFALYHFSYDSIYQQRYSSGEIVNPINGLTREQAISQFNESFVYYLLYNIKAYNLHPAPLSSAPPRMEIIVDSDTYNAEVSKGEIYVSAGEIVTKDIIIKTTKEEGVKMLENSSYISESFSSGLSSIQTVESKSTLFGKGYLSIYNQLTGKSITGNIIKIYRG